MKILSILLVFVFLLQLQITPPMTLKTKASLAELHQQAMVVDLHCDALYQMVTRNYLITDKEGPAGYSPQISAKSLREGGVDVQTFAVWVPSNRVSDYVAYGKQALEKFQAVTKEASPLMQARSANDIYLAKEQGRIAALLSIEGAEAIGDKAENLRGWAEAGLVLVGLIWNRKNAFCDAAQAKEKPFGGLSKEGEALVDLAAELGILLDVSHASDDSFWDVMRRTTRPVIASHSSSRAVYTHARNLDDEQIRAIRATGGVIGVNFHSPFLSAKRPVTIDEVVEHVLHIMKTGGASVAALGTDFDGDIVAPRGLESAAKLPALTEALSAQGVSSEDLELFLGKNFLRSFAKVTKKQFEVGSIPIPLRGLTVSATSQQEKSPASAVADFNGRTQWRAAVSDPAPTLTIESNRPARSIALRGAYPRALQAKVSFRCGGSTQTKAIEIPADAEGVTLHMEATEGSGCRVLVELASTGEVGVSEVVLYE
jgi:membrane dipeptidase